LNKWKLAFFVCLTLLIISSTVFIYNTIDLGISYTYLEVSYDDQVEANKVLGNLILRGGEDYTQKDFLHLLRLEYPEEFIVEENQKILMGSNSFEFEHNKLVRVR